MRKTLFTRFTGWLRSRASSRTSETGPRGAQAPEAQAEVLWLFEPPAASGLPSRHALQKDMRRLSQRLSHLNQTLSSLCDPDMTDTPRMLRPTAFDDMLFDGELPGRSTAQDTTIGGADSFLFARDNAADTVARLAA